MSLYNPNNVPTKVSDEDFVHIDEFVIESSERFHIGQSYEAEKVQVLECVHCKGKEFNVTTGSYFTAIRCVKCLYEICIHER